MKNLLKSTDVKVYLSLLVYATAILFVISPDSYTHDLTGHIDSACFFMCGKAWMNGMIPYVDFADSKGPLLWLIEGVGYLISRYNYIGVFWLSCLLYSVTFYICYKIGTLLTQSRRIGYATALLMAFPYFCCLFHYEVRAEDWCQPFIAASLYCLLKEILRPSAKSAHVMGIVFGLSFMAALLIKWSVAVMTLSFAASGFIILVRRKRSVAGYILCCVAAAAVLFLPFAAYMAATDSFGAFIREYFLNTGKTVTGGGVFGFIVGYCKDIAHLFLTRGKYLYVIYMAAIYAYYRKRRDITVYPLLCGLFFLALSIKHDLWHYYVSVVSTFAIFLAVFIAREISRRYTLGAKSLATLFAVSMILNFANMARGLRGQGGYMFFQHNGRKELYDAAYLMSQVKSPKIMNSSLEVGIGMTANTLPATLYWSRQNGATAQMDESRWDAVAQHKPDFITVTVFPADTLLKQKAIAAGYHYYMTLTNHGRELYGPAGLKLPPKDFRVSDMDILLKRRIIVSRK